MMGMIYRRKKRDPATGKLEEQGPYWMKYYIEGRPIQESTKVFEKEQAKKILKVKEGEVAAGLYRGPSMDRIRFEDLAHWSNRTTRSTGEKRFDGSPSIRNTWNRISVKPECLP
jgi:hypothetical protein